MRFRILLLLIAALIACAKEAPAPKENPIFGVWLWESPRQNGDMIRFDLREDGNYTMQVQSEVSGTIMREENEGVWRFDHKSIIFSPKEKPQEQMDYLFLRRDEMEIVNSLGEKFFFQRQEKTKESGS